MAATPDTTPVETAVTSVTETATQSTDVLMDSFYSAYGQVLGLGPKIIAMLVGLGKWLERESS